MCTLTQRQLLKLVEHHCEWFGVDDDDYNDDGGDNDYVDMELGERQVGFC